MRIHCGPSAKIGYIKPFLPCVQIGELTADSQQGKLLLNRTWTLFAGNHQRRETFCRLPSCNPLLFDLAHEIGMTGEGLYKALGENGNPNFATVMRLTRALVMKLRITA